MEPTHDTSARSTATSASEGRLKVGVSLRKKKKDYLKNSVKGQYWKYNRGSSK